MPLPVETASTVYETAHAGEAAYLCLLGYDEPTCRRLSKDIVKFCFTAVQQEDLLRFSRNESMYIAPLALLRKREKLIAKARALLEGLNPLVFSD